MEIILNREQRIVLLRALKDGRIDPDKLSECGLAGPSKFENMTDEELENEIVRMQSSIRNCKPIYEDKVAQRVCKECYKSMGCWVAWEARNDRELRDKIDAIFQSTQ